MLAAKLPIRPSSAVPPMTFSMLLTPPVPVAVPEVRLTLAFGEDLAADFAAWEGGVWILT